MGPRAGGERQETLTPQGVCGAVGSSKAALDGTPSRTVNLSRGFGHGPVRVGLDVARLYCSALRASVATRMRDSEESGENKSLERLKL